MTILEAEILTKFHPTWPPSGSTPHTNTKVFTYSWVTPTVGGWEEGLQEETISHALAHACSSADTSWLMQQQQNDVW